MNRSRFEPRLIQASLQFFQINFLPFISDFRNPTRLQFVINRSFQNFPKNSDNRLDKLSGDKKIRIRNNKPRALDIKRYARDTKRPSRALSPTYEKNCDELMLQKKVRTNVVSPSNILRPLLGSLELMKDPILNKKRLDRKKKLVDLISDEEISQIREKIWANIHKDKSDDFSAFSKRQERLKQQVNIIFA